MSTKTQALGLLPFLLFGLLLALFLSQGSASSIGYSGLLPVFNVFFTALIPFLVAVVSTRLFLIGGIQGYLLLGNGLTSFGLGNLLAEFLMQDPQGVNLAFTVHNSAALISSLFFLAGSLFLFINPNVIVQPRRRVWILVGDLLLVGILLALLTAGVLTESIPPFFLQDMGQTAVRQGILLSSSFLFLLSAFLLLTEFVRKNQTLLYWAGLALAFFGLGLTTIYLSAEFGDQLYWLGRGAQYLGSVYLLIGVARAYGETRSRGIPHDEILQWFLLQSEANYKELIHSAFDAIISFDRKGRIHMWNPMAERIFGFKGADVLGHPIQDIILPDGTLETLCSLVDDFSNTSGGTFEKSLKRRDGTIFPAAISLSSRKLKVLNESMNTALIRDISEQKRFETELRNHSAQLSALHDISQQILVETSREGILERLASASRDLIAAKRVVAGFLDRQGVFRIDACSHDPELPPCPPEGTISLERGVYMDLIEKCTTLRLTQKELISHPAWWGTPPDHPPLKGLLGARLTSREGDPHGLLLLTDKNGDEFTAQDEVILGQLAAVASLALQKLEALSAIEQRVLERTLELEKANRIKDDFLANMSHEIRTPMSGVLGMLDLLLQEPLSEELRGDVEIIWKSAKSVLALQDDLLDISRIERGIFEIRSVPFDPAELVEHILRPFELRARDKQIDLYVHMGPELPVQLLGDPNRLGQVLKNLLSNALKFTDTGSVRVRVDGIHSSPDSFTLCLEVVDTGIGIPPDKHQQIFHSFTQLDAGLTKRFEGTGLGLTITKQIVERMSGEIELESEDGQGALFRVKIPLGIPLQETRLESACKELQLADLPCLNILVAEDNPVNQVVLERSLSGAGHRVTLTGNGQEALEKLSEDLFDCVLMDVQMPVMNGLEATRQIRLNKANPGTQNIPIIALTAYAMKDDRQRCTDSGMDGYVSKPVDFDELARVLCIVLNRKTTGRIHPGFEEKPKRSH